MRLPNATLSNIYIIIMSQEYHNIAQNRLTFFEDQIITKIEDMGSTEYLLPGISAGKQKTIVLAMDKTLLYLTRCRKTSCSWCELVKLGSTDITAHLHKRPHVDSLLEALAKLNYEIIDFTSAEKEYVDDILDKVDVNKVIDYRLYRDSCTKVTEGSVKDLSKLGRDLKNVIIADDNPVSYNLQPENAFPIKQVVDYEYNDTELLELIDFCKLAAEAEDVREAFKMQLNTCNDDETSTNVKSESSEEGE
ncbi:hypothetical protein SUGI_0248420 [Cryptomeria japonica]|nr:hypothetical protein SUGI_0248420 [Cryptomeria japonica]